MLRYVTHGVGFERGTAMSVQVSTAVPYRSVQQ